VSWCPLGLNGQPVAGFWNTGFAAGVFHSPWSAWTVVPRQTFGNRTRVTSVAVDGGTLAGPRAAFVVQSRPPTFGNGMRRAAGAADFQTRIIDRPRSATPGASIGTPPAVPVTRGPATSPAHRGSIRWESGQPGQRVPGGTFSIMGTGRTAVRPELPPTGGMYYGPQIPSESPYERAARVARDRSPGTGRQPLRGDPITPGNPYPPQYQSPVPEPFRYVPSSPAFGAPVGGVYEHRGTPIIYPSPMSRGGSLSPPRGVGLAPSQGLGPIARPGIAAPSMGLTPRMAAPPAGSLPMGGVIVPRGKN
jgi:hypothetical protein